MNWIDEKIHEWLVNQTPSYSNTEYGLDNTVLDGEFDLEDLGQIIAKEARTQGAQEALAKVEEWVKENEYCSKCCSPKKYCPNWGKFASATDTSDLLHHLQQLKDNKKEV